MVDKDDCINRGTLSMPTNLSDSRLEALEGKTVLVVVDDPLLVRIAKGHLKDFAGNCRIDEASSSKEAIRKIEEGLNPDVILSDIMMPGGSGLELYKWLIENRPDLKDKIIFVSGGVDDRLPGAREFQQEIISKNRFLGKPYMAVELRRHIFLVLNRPAQQDKKSPVISETPDDEKAEERKRIAGKIVHDFNNPLAIILCNISFLRDTLRDRKLSDDEWGMIDDISNGVNRIRELVSHLKSDIIEGTIPFKDEKKS